MNGDLRPERRRAGSLLQSHGPSFSQPRLIGATRQVLPLLAWEGRGNDTNDGTQRSRADSEESIVWLASSMSTG
jgi:hypothetical protein